MSQKYINPVNEHFIYNDETRKSKCKQCHFNMAGRHSENLMRHLKRKHPVIYEDVMHQKQLRRDRLAIQQRQGSPMSPKSSALKFTTEPQEMFVKLDPANIVTTTDSADEEEDHNDDGEGDNYNGADVNAGTDIYNDDIASSCQPSNELFEKVFIGKSEVQDIDDDNANNIENDQLDRLNIESSRTSFQGTPNHIQSRRYCNQSTVVQVSSKHPQQQAFLSTSLATERAGSLSNTPTHAPSPVYLGPALAGNGDDAFYLQYLGNKFSKYSTRTKNIVQFQINRILYKADMGGFDNIDSSKIFEMDYT